jgi:hypothetical protein
MLLDFNVKGGRKDIFRLTIGNESLHEMSNDGEVRVVNFLISKNLTVQIRCSHTVTFPNIIGCLLMGRPTIRLTIF